MWRASRSNLKIAESDTSREIKMEALQQGQGEYCSHPPPNGTKPQGQPRGDLDERRRLEPGRQHPVRCEGGPGPGIARLARQDRRHTRRKGRGKSPGEVARLPQ